MLFTAVHGCSRRCRDSPGLLGGAEAGVAAVLGQEGEHLGARGVRVGVVQGCPIDDGGSPPAGSEASKAGEQVPGHAEGGGVSDGAERVWRWASGPGSGRLPPARLRQHMLFKLGRPVGRPASRCSASEHSHTDHRRTTDPRLGSSRAGAARALRLAAAQGSGAARQRQERGAHQDSLHGLLRVPMLWTVMPSVEQAMAAPMMPLSTAY